MEALVKEWYTTGEAEKITGFGYKTFCAAIYRGKITKYKKEGKNHLLHREVLQEYLGKRLVIESNPKANELSEEEWYTAEQAEIITGYDSRSFTRRIREGKITHYKKVGKHYFIHKDVVQKYLEEKNFIKENYWSIKEAAKFLKKSIDSIHDLTHRKELQGVRKFGDEAYLPKTEVKKYYKRMYETYSIKEVCKITGLSKFEVNNLIQNKVLEAEQVNNYIWYVSKESVRRFLDDDNNYMKIGTKDKRLKTYNVKGLGEKVIKKDYDEFLKLKEKFYTLNEIDMEFGIKPPVTIKSIINKGFVNGSINKNQYMVSKEDFHKFLATIEGIKLLYFGKENYYDYFNRIMDALIRDSVYKDTLTLYRVWAFDKIKNSKSHNKKSMVGYIISTIERLNNALCKEIYLYNNDEIKSMLDDKSIGFISTNIEYLTIFLNALMQKRKCSFTNNYSMRAVYDSNRNANEAVYTKIEWVAYCSHLSNVETHIVNAINKRRYAETWLFCLLHLSLAWRNIDIKKMPNVSLELAGIEDFNWLNNNKMTLEKAQVIINDLRRRSIGIQANKNGRKTHLIIGLTVPTAIALVICEIHRRKSNNDTEVLLTFKYRTCDFKRVLGDELPPFSSLKCNRSLLTYEFETAVNKEGKAHIAYQLCAYARSHTEYLDKINDITSVYLVTTNTDASADNMALHLFERGFFGWQIGIMLGLVYDNQEWNITEKTNMIKSMNEIYSPMAVEGMSEYIYTRNKQAKELLKELLALPRSEIMQKLEDFANYKSPAMIDYSQCIKGLKNCRYNTPKMCLGCQYHIPTNYILEIVKVNLDEIMDSLDKCPINDTVKRTKLTYLLDKLMYVLTDFRLAYKKYDNNYIKSFIDLEKLMERYNSLESAKLLHIANWGN